MEEHSACFLSCHISGSMHHCKCFVNFTSWELHWLHTILKKIKLCWIATVIESPLPLSTAAHFFHSKICRLLQFLKEEKIDCEYSQLDGFVFSEANDASYAATAVQKEYNATRDANLTDISLVSSCCTACQEVNCSFDTILRCWNLQLVTADLASRAVQKSLWQARWLQSVLAADRWWKCLHTARLMTFTLERKVSSFPKPCSSLTLQF